MMCTRMSHARHYMTNIKSMTRMYRIWSQEAAAQAAAGPTAMPARPEALDEAQIEELVAQHLQQDLQLLPETVLKALALSWWQIVSVYIPAVNHIPLVLSSSNFTN